MAIIVGVCNDLTEWYKTMRITGTGRCGHFPHDPLSNKFGLKCCSSVKQPAINDQVLARELHLTHMKKATILHIFHFLFSRINTLFTPCCYKSSDSVMHCCTLYDSQPTRSHTQGIIHSLPLSIQMSMPWHKVLVILFSQK